jgi:hypothetical protein
MDLSTSHSDILASILKYVCPNIARGVCRRWKSLIEVSGLGLISALVWYNEISLISLYIGTQKLSKSALQLAVRYNRISLISRIFADASTALKYVIIEDNANMFLALINILSIGHSSDIVYDNIGYMSPNMYNLALQFLPISPVLGINIIVLGNLPILKLLHSTMFSDDYMLAVDNGHLHILKYIYTTFPYISRDISIIEHASNRGFRHIVEWFISVHDAAEKMSYRFRNMIKNPIKSGYTSIVNLLIENEYPLPENTCEIASANGQLEMLKLLVAKGSVMTEWVPILAANAGHLHILEYCYTLGIQFDVRCRIFAKEYGHMAVVEW